MYLAQMEALNIPYTLEMFISSPKEGMIKGLWKNHNNEPQVDIASNIETPHFNSQVLLVLTTVLLKSVG